MKRSKADTAETRRRIVEIAAQAFKRNGIDATRVSQVMGEANMTPGAFYRHFASKEELVAAACVASMDALLNRADQAIEGGYEAFLIHMENALSDEINENHQSGSALIAIGSELIRAGKEARRTASKGFQALITIILSRSDLPQALRQTDVAMFTLSSMIGAVTMAKIVDDPTLSQQILDVVKATLIATTSGTDEASSRSG